MARYKVLLQAHPTACTPLNARDAVEAHGLVSAPCARDAAREVAAPYVGLGLTVDWQVRRAGIGRAGRRWRGQFAPDGGDDGKAGVREPRRPRPSPGSASAVAEL